jgi:hypothetical protein
MPRDWNKYHNRNITGGDCQLVNACNAYYHFTGNAIDQESDQYQEFVDLCKCRHGSAINIKLVWEELGITEDQRFKWYDILSEDHLKPGCFFEANIWHKFFGFHSVSVVDYEPRCDALRIANLRHVTSTDGWIFREDLQPHITDNVDRSKPEWEFRTFKLIE